MIPALAHFSAKGSKLVANRLFSKLKSAPIIA
jgi:hypothetical protein